VAIADVFDALTDARPYKQAWSVADAVTEISAQRGHQFDPEVVDAFLRVLPDSDLDAGADAPLAAAA
jgi:putative two-component system response regulator